MYRLRAFVCHSTRNNEISILNSLKSLADKGKFIFSNDPESILSSKMMDEKINEFNNSITEFTDFYKDDTSFEKEVEILKKIERVAQKYDDITNNNSVLDGSENKSMEWMYNYVYRFQCMSAHQSLRDKEKVFNLFDYKKEPNNTHILGLLGDIVEQILILLTLEKGRNYVLK